MIDIGGPSLLRAAAKNFAHVAPRRRARSGTRPCSTSCASTASVSLDTRRSLAARDVRDHRGVRGGDRRTGSRAARPFPERLSPTFLKVRDLAYGENPHQRAAYYAEARRAAPPALAGRAAARQGALATTT